MNELRGFCDYCVWQWQWKHSFLFSSYPTSRCDGCESFTVTNNYSLPQHSAKYTTPTILYLHYSHCRRRAALEESQAEKRKTENWFILIALCWNYSSEQHLRKVSLNVTSHTHTLSGTTQVSRYQKGKTNLDYTGARDSEWQWHQLSHMQVCTSLQTDNHASTSLLKFFYRPDALPAAQPTVSKHWRHLNVISLCQNSFRIQVHL